jgi:hypothetical protein
MAMEEQMILDEIEEIKESIEWSSPEAKRWHLARLADAELRLSSIQGDSK